MITNNDNTLARIKNVLLGWRSVISHGKAILKCEKGQEKFIAGLIREGCDILKELETEDDCPICGSPLEEMRCSDAGNNNCQYIGGIR